MNNEKSFKKESPEHHVGEYMFKERLPKITRLQSDINGLLEDVIKIADILQTGETMSKHAHEMLAQTIKEKCLKIHDAKETILSITKEDFFYILYGKQNEDDEK